MVGDIYLGKVAKIMPGIRAAFIDIGLKQDAFLHFSDIGSSLSEYSSLISDEDSDVDLDDGPDEEEENSADNTALVGGDTAVQVAKPVVERPPQRQHRSNGRELNLPDLKKGQDIIVQITKEPVAKKGVRVTSEVSLQIGRGHV